MSISIAIGSILELAIISAILKIGINSRIFTAIWKLGLYKYFILIFPKRELLLILSRQRLHFNLRT